MAPFKYIFSLAVNSISNPAPNSIKGAIVPLHSTFPLVGSNTPAITFNNVLFPAPFKPTIPNTSPLFISRDIPLRAQNSSNNNSLLSNFKTYSFIPFTFSLLILNLI